MHRVLAHLEHQTVASVPDCITVPSLAMQREMNRSWQMRRPPRVVPNFMDVPETPAPLPSDDGAQTIVCIGRIEPLKGQDVLVRAFDLIARKHPLTRLRIVGPDRWPGRFRFAQLLPQWVPDPAIRARIDLPGAVPLGQVPAILREARLAVIASRGFESFSFAALEAMAHNRPLVATTVGALPELIQPERNGLLVAPEDPFQMAHAMSRLLQDRQASESFALAGYTLARDQYHTPRVLPQIMAAYEDGSDYFYQVRAAGAERTAQQWRRALDAARAWSEREEPQRTQRISQR
jgi:glycosyltransferase involved in cell wall biosynthesis